MIDMLMIILAIIGYGAIVYTIQVLILKLDPFKDPWDGDF
jgi:hypothetical protein